MIELKDNFHNSKILDVLIKQSSEKDSDKFNYEINDFFLSISLIQFSLMLMLSYWYQKHE